MLAGCYFPKLTVLTRKTCFKPNFVPPMATFTKTNVRILLSSSGIKIG